NCVAVFVPGSIRNASNAVVKVQPNPASSVAKLTIEGVNGNVDYALIDINGRVISQKVINANATEQINLEGLARGTYFVRITNNNFTKVEKLIVR
ncbi:MAG: T9SS type A sorting domain-containing protein, partial [Bacteroidales bacterium]|nr:T9SS type A sorting domain-containing protein [Bacteroidales bacterium]